MRIPRRIRLVGLSVLTALTIVAGGVIVAMPAQAAALSAIKVVSGAPSQYIGKYWSTDNSSGGPLKANRSTIGAWEKFTVWTENSQGRPMAFKANMNVKWVCADQNGARPLIANRSTRGAWETFVFQPTGVTDEFKLQFPGNGKWVVVQSNGDLIANGTAAQATTFLEVFGV